MLYVEQSLSPGEEIVFVGQFPWVYTLHAIVYIFAGIFGAVAVIAAATYFEVNYSRSGYNYTGWLDAVHDLNPGIRLAAFFVFIMGLLRFAHMMVVRVATEVAVTSSRIILKFGLISRVVHEISIDRIEGVNVQQTTMGRLFGYGSLMVQGMGTGAVLFPPLANPIAFRKAIEKARTV